ncbi:GNAT family N-acetyltransferase [Camelliibacillus cellulosilyticus]|uniref:GNAT family N-acetyltransferase n=1 Tax=Camelliibacillus cellulosilyticus TaxID=2174486 RepID=A0ABV9GMU2_9BACL
MSTIINRPTQLQRYEPDFYAKLKAFVLPENQAQFTALPEDKLGHLTVGQHPVVILNHREPVGFFLLNETDRVKEYTDNPKAMLLTALSIDYSKQGKGVATAAMNQLKSFVNREFPECNEIVLAVNHKNIAAQHLYRKVGFNDTGRRKIGKKGEQFILRLLV